MGLLTFSGRVLLSTIFIISGVSKFTSYDEAQGSPMVDVVGPKLECFLDGVERATSVELALDPKPYYGEMILAAGVLEVVGGLLFVLDLSIGAALLMLVLLGITPVMHNFWDAKCYGDEQLSELINFLKNLAIFGALLAYMTKVGKYQKFKIE